MKHLGKSFRAISPVLAVLMMIAVAIAGSLVVYAWVMGYITLSTEKSGEAITIQNVVNIDFDLVVYVQNTGEGVVQLEEAACLYVNGELVPCKITGVAVSDDTATLNEGETATMYYLEGAAHPGEKIEIKVTTLLGISAEYYDYHVGTALAVHGLIMWARTYGGTGNEFALSVVANSDGGYTIVGGAAESVEVSGFWLIKTDESGDMLWNRTYGGLAYDVAHALIETADGGYAIVGRTTSFSSGYYDFWLVKTDAAGNMEWNKTYGGTEWDIAHSVVQTSDGGYVIAGSTDSFGAGLDDVWLVKTNSSGNMEWNKTYGGTGNDSAHSIVATSDGGHAIAGYTNSSGAGANDFFLVKNDATGNMEWNQTYGGSSLDEAYSLVATSDGGYAIAGTTKSFGAGDQDFWLVKTY